MVAHLKLVKLEGDFAIASEPGSRHLGLDKTPLTAHVVASKQGVTEILHHLGLDKTPPSAAAAQEWAKRKEEITDMFTHLQCETVGDLIDKTSGGKHMPEVAKFFGIPIGNADSIEKYLKSGVVETLHHLGLDKTPPSPAAAKEWAKREEEITDMFTHLQCETVADLARKTDGGKHMPEVAKFFNIPVGNADSIERLVREKSAPKTPHLS